MSNTLDTFTEATDLQTGDLLHIKRGTGINSDKKITRENVRKSLITLSKTISVENPSAGEDISFFFTNIAITITEIRAVLVGSAGPIINWSVRHSTDRSAVGTEVVTGGTVTTDTTAGSDVTTFDAPAITADSHVWLETTAQGGTVDSIVITVFYTED